MIHVPRLKDENAAELFLGFRIGTVGSCHFAVLPIQGQGGFRRLKRFSTSKMPVGAKMVVVFKACVEHRVLFALGHAFEFVFIEVSKTDVFHCSSPLGGSRIISLARWIVHPIVVAHRKNPTAEANYFYFNSSIRLARKRRSGPCRARASAFSYEARASGIRPNLRHRSARAECAR